MPSDQAAADTQPVRDGMLKARIRTELATRFIWPPPLMAATRPLRDLAAVMDTGKLLAVAATVHDNREIGFTIISKEYIQTGLNWVYAMRRLGLKNFLIVAGDQTTADILDELGVANVVANVDDQGFDASFVSHDGFSAKGLSMIALKFPVARVLLAHGYSVVFSDADAVWLNDPMPYVRDADVAFQRVVYHPAPIAPLWGFTACTGFVAFRHAPNTIAFLDQCIIEQQSFRCDQVSLNLAMLEAEPDWHCDHADWSLPAAGARHDRSSLEAAFGKCAQAPIWGRLRDGGVRVLALPHDKFWRHGWVTSALPEMVVCHPNSPKNDLEKMKIFSAAGLRFAPETV
jgi:hypothetical protein